MSTKMRRRVAVTNSKFYNQRMSPVCPHSPSNLWLRIAEQTNKTRCGSNTHPPPACGTDAYQKVSPNQQITQTQRPHTKPQPEWGRSPSIYIYVYGWIARGRTTTTTGEMVRYRTRCTRWVRRDADMARQIVVVLRKPIRRIRLINLAYWRNWDEVFHRIDHGKAGVNDFGDFFQASRRRWHASDALPI